MVVAMETGDGVGQPRRHDSGRSTCNPRKVVRVSEASKKPSSLGLF